MLRDVFHSRPGPELEQPPSSAKEGFLSPGELQTMFRIGLDRLREDLSTEDVSPDRVTASMHRLFREAIEARKGRDLPEGESKRRFSEWLIQGIGRLGADLPPHVRGMLFQDFQERAPMERVYGALKLPPRGNQETPDITRYLEKMTELETTERRFLSPEDRLAWGHLFDALRQRFELIDPSSGDTNKQATHYIDGFNDLLSESPQLTHAIGRDQEAAAEAFVMELDILSTGAPLVAREEVLLEMLSRLPPEVAIPLVAKQDMQFSLASRHKLIRDILSHVQDPIAVLKRTPSFTEGMSPTEVIKDIADWSPSEAVSLVGELPPDEALTAMKGLVYMQPNLLAHLPDNIRSPEARKTLALAVLDQNPCMFLRVAKVLGEHAQDIVERKGDFLERLVRTWDETSSLAGPAPFLRLQESLPLSEEECAQIAEHAVQHHLLNFDAFLAKRVDEEVLQRIKTLPETRRVQIVESGIRAVTPSDPLLVARISRYFGLSREGLLHIRQHYPELKSANYVHPEFGGILSGLALRPYEESSADTSKDLGPDAEQVLTETERISTQLTDLIQNIAPDRIKKESERTLQEDRLRRTIHYEADLGVGLASSLIVVFKDTYEPAIYKPRAREAKEDPYTHIPIRLGIHQGESAIREWLAVQIDKVFQLDVVPPTILRHGSHGLGSVQKWEKGRFSNDLESGTSLTAAALMRIALFDVITQNSDRHSKNFLVAEDGVIRGIDHGYIFSRTNGGVDGLRSHPLAQVQGMPVPEDLRANIRLFKRSPDLQSALRSAFDLAFPGDPPENIDRLWGEFMKRLDTLDPDDPSAHGIFPAPSYD